MRSREFIYSLEDIYEMTDNMKPMFVESLTSRFSSIKWAQNGVEFTGIGTFKEHPNQIIIITLNAFPYPFNGVNYNTVYIEFARVINGIATCELLDLNQSDPDYIDPSKIFGSIFNALLNKIKELNAKYTISAIVFTVDKNEVKRLSLYSRMLTRAHGNNTWKIIHTFEDENYNGLLASNHVFSDDELVQLKAELAKYAEKD